MKAVEKSFVSARYLASLSYWNLTCVYYPEITFGGETWMVKDGGTFKTIGFNNYFRLTPKFTGIPLVDTVFDAMESWVIGYAYGDTDKRPTRIYSIGARFMLEN